MSCSPKVFVSLLVFAVSLFMLNKPAYTDTNVPLDSDTITCNNDMRDKNYTAALQRCQLSASQGSASAQYNLALLYSNGWGVRKNYVIAADWLRKSADNNYSDAMVLLSDFYFNGTGVAVSLTMSNLLLRKSVDLGNPIAQYKLAVRHLDGKVENKIKKTKRTLRSQSTGGSSINYTRAVELLTLSSQNNYSDSQYLLGGLYLNGEGVDQNASKGVRYISFSALNGNGDAQYLLGLIYEQGVYVKKDSKKFIKWYTIASENGNKQAAWALDRFAQSDNVKRNKCRIYYERARFRQSLPICIKQASSGDPVSAYYLARLHYFGHANSNKKRDYDRAHYWYLKSAAQGHAKAMFALAKLYDTGQGVEKNVREKLKWMSLSANQGHPNAQYLLGYNYYKGRGVPQNDFLAFRWMSLSEKNGSKRADLMLSQMYFFGHGVQKNRALAHLHRLKAAELSESHAMFGSAMDYYFGRGTAVNYRLAERWFRLCVSTIEGQEHWSTFHRSVLSKCQYHLGMLYEFGEGVDRNFNMAVKWYLESRMNGQRWPVNALDRLGYKDRDS